MYEELDITLVSVFTCLGLYPSIKLLDNHNNPKEINTITKSNDERTRTMYIWYIISIILIVFLFIFFWITFFHKIPVNYNIPEMLILLMSIINNIVILDYISCESSDIVNSFESMNSSTLNKMFIVISFICFLVKLSLICPY